MKLRYPLLCGRSGFVYYDSKDYRYNFIRYKTELMSYATTHSEANFLRGMMYRICREGISHEEAEEYIEKFNNNELWVQGCT